MISIELIHKLANAAVAFFHGPVDQEDILVSLYGRCGRTGCTVLRGTYCRVCGWYEKGLNFEKRQIACDIEFENIPPDFISESVDSQKTDTKRSQLFLLDEKLRLRSDTILNKEMVEP